MAITVYHDHSIQIRLCLYNHAGTVIGYLNEATDIRLTTSLCDSSTLEFSYPVRGPRVDYLTAMAASNALAEVGVEITVSQHTDAWVKPPLPRFIVTSLTRDLTNPTPDYLQLKLVGNESRLSDAVVLPATNVTEENKGQQIVSGNPWYIARTFFDQASQRGWGADLTYPGTNWDSAAASWNDIQTTLSVAGGTTLRAVLDEFVDRGLMEWRMNQRNLQVFHVYPSPSEDPAGTSRPAMGMSRDLTKLVRLPLVDGMYTDAEDSYDWGDRCSKVIVEGDDSKTFSFDNTSSYTRATSAVWGSRLREVYVKAQGVTDSTQAYLVAAPYLREGRTRSDTIKRSYRVDLLSLPPLTELRVGDWVTVERSWNDSTGYTEQCRLVGLKLEWGDDGCVADFTLGRVRDGVLKKLYRAAKGTENGVAVSSVSGSPAKYHKDNENPLIPVTPNTPTVSQSITAGGAPVASLSTTAVTSSTDGRSLSGGSVTYEFQYRENSTASWNTVQGATFGPSASINELKQGTYYQARVRALFWLNDNDGGLPQYSKWSSTTSFRTLADTTAPPTPSAPTVRTQFQAAEIMWDGLAANGDSGTPVDFDHLGIALVPHGGELRETHATAYRDVRSLTVAGLTAQDYDVAIRSYDKYGNVSAWSNVATFTASATVDVDSIQAAVDAALSPLEDTIGKAVELSNAVNLIADRVLIEDWETPPEEGVVDTSYWHGPDGQWWILRQAPTTGE